MDGKAHVVDDRVSIKPFHQTSCFKHVGVRQSRHRSRRPQPGPTRTGAQRAGPTCRPTRRKEGSRKRHRGEQHGDAHEDGRVCGARLDQEASQQSADRQRSRESHANTKADRQRGPLDEEPHDSAGPRTESHANTNFLSSLNDGKRRHGIEPDRSQQ